MKVFECRSFLFMLGMTIITLGLYPWIWIIETKRKLNRIGGNIPISFLMFVPGVNLYFYYCYAQSYAKIVKKNSDIRIVIPYFLLISFSAIITLIKPFISISIAGLKNYSYSLSIFSQINPWADAYFNLNIGLSSHSYSLYAFIFSYTLFSLAKAIALYVLQKSYNQYEG